MFAMSVNDVPGWLVTIPPSAIGVPVAATPGLVPHCEVLTAEALAVDVLAGGAWGGGGAAAGALWLEATPVLLLELELELLLQPAAASAMAPAMTIVLRAESIFAVISPPLRW